MMAQSNITEESSCSVITVIGIANVVGRIGFGALADLTCISSVQLVSLSMFTAGFCLFLFPFSSAYYEYFRLVNLFIKIAIIQRLILVTKYLISLLN